MTPMDACIMGTLHSAKGLEFSAVFLVGVEDGSLPHERSIFDQRQLKKKGVSLYVGMTRAKRFLYLSLRFPDKGIWAIPGGRYLGSYARSPGNCWTSRLGKISVGGCLP